MNRDEWFVLKWRYMKRFALMGAIGIGFLVLADTLHMEIFALGVILIVPLIFWLVMVPLLHWKDRYVGTRSTLWGALLLIETSGWFKIAYWFRHVIPDWRKLGRYENVDKVSGEGDLNVCKYRMKTG